MHMPQRTKQGLDEVKLTLQRLQRIAMDPSDSDMQAADMHAADMEAQPPGGLSGIAEAPLSALTKALPAGLVTKRNAVTGAVAVAGLVAAAGILSWLLLHKRDVEPMRTAATAVDVPVPVRPTLAPPSPPPMSNESRAIAEAQSLMDTGGIAGARRILTDIAPRSAEAALMLARCYDPNFLSQLTQPDASPDPAEAERWYRTWHNMAAQNGLSMEPDRLERIIKAMR